MDKRNAKRIAVVGAGTSSGAAGEGSAAVADAGAGLSSSERVGSLAVEVDREQILAEAASIAASSSSSDPAAPIAPAGELVVDVNTKAADVAPSVRMLVEQCSAAFAPGWELTKQETDGVGDAAALVLAYWMPDGALDPKYLCILSLAGALYAVADKRRLSDGTFRPLRAPRPARPLASSAPIETAPPASSSLKL